MQIGKVKTLADVRNISDFRELARRRLPFPVFHYIDGGVRRGTHVLKALSLGATAASGGRLYLYALAAAGRDGVERAVRIMQDEIVRDMKLMGKTRIDQFTRDNLRFR